MSQDIGCGILAGGSSLRMGQDKAFLPVGDKPLIRIIVDPLKPIFSEILIATKSPEKFHAIGLNAVKDEDERQCPLTGIYTILKNSQKRYSFIIACDMPYINSELIKLLINETNDHDVVCPAVLSIPQVLHAIYSKRCIDIIKQQLKGGRLKVSDFFNEVNTRIIGVDVKKWLIHNKSPFTSLNSPDDFNDYLMFRSLALKGPRAIS